MDIRQSMPVLARHEGVWEGTYVLVDEEGKVLDRHASRLTCRMPADGPHAYHQTNEYTWADGRREVFDFPAAFADGRIWFDTDRIEGSAWEIDDATIVLHWKRKDLPGSSLYEMIQISPDGQHRARTWHWFKEDRVFQRTLIRERKVS